jgi:transcriptional regulator with XRE-family HTH domain
MITRIRDVRRAKKMTLQDVADRCVPPTTPQTIGRLETGTRTVSVGWLNRIARALGVEAADLVTLPEREDIPSRPLSAMTAPTLPAAKASSSPRRPRRGSSRSPFPPASATIARAMKSGATASRRSNSGGR